MRSAAAEAIIAAPIDKVWQVMMDFDRYPEWNPFTVRIECPGRPRVGASVKLHVRWADGTGVVSPETIARLEPPPPAGGGPRRGVFGYNFGTLLSTLNLVRSRRLQIVESLPEGQTRYRTEIELTGLLANLTPIAKVQEGFDRQTAALKARCESP
jgi:hypothetical protein